MTWMTGLLAGLLAVAAGSCFFLLRRYRVLQRRDKALQRSYNQAEAQLNTYWLKKTQ